MLSNKTSEEQDEEWGWFLAQLTVKMWNTRPKACVEAKRVFNTSSGECGTNDWRRQPSEL